MKKFEVIEEGRLSKLEMAELKGGEVTCGLEPWGGTYNVQSCYAYNVTCTLNYKSCSDTIPGAYTTCLIITYSGQPGGGGAKESGNEGNGDGISVTERDDYLTVEWAD